MANNRKATKGRRIQIIDVPEHVFVQVEQKGSHSGAIIKHLKRIKNEHPKAGKSIQVRHAS